MTYPNSPVDARPDVWGWPWHGMIVGTPSTDSTPSQLILPSGARIECASQAGDAHNTHLWDIGMPDPEIESEDPDERWWNKAIIRSKYSGDHRKTAFCYSGELAFGESHPMHVLGAGTLMRRLEVSQRSSGGVANIVISLFVSNSLAVELPLSRAQLQLPSPDVFSRRLVDFRVQLMDESPNGRSALYWIAPRVVSFGTEYLALGRTLLEITITGDPEQGFGLAHRIIEPYSVHVESQRYPTEADRGNFVQVQWADSLDVGANTVIGWEADGPPAGYPYALVSWPQGTATRHTLTETPIWAWYNPDGSIEVIRCRSESRATETYSTTDPGDDQYYAESSRLVVTLTSSAGEVTKEFGGDYVSQAYETSPMSGSISWTSVTYLYGEPIASSSGSQSWDWTNRAGPSYGDPEVMDQHPILSAMVYPDGMIVLSNNILATIQRGFAFEESAPTHWWCGDALTPGGIDLGLYKFDTANPNGGTLGAWQIGSYNPITGELVRNRADKYCSWV